MESQRLVAQRESLAERLRQEFVGRSIRDVVLDSGDVVLILDDGRQVNLYSHCGGPTLLWLDRSLQNGQAITADTKSGLVKPGAQKR